MTSGALVFPHQLFEDVEYFLKIDKIFLIEEYLFFKQFPFHKQKIAFHRASMKFYEYFLKNKGFSVEYIDSTNELSDIRSLIPYLKQDGFKKIVYIDPTDNWLRKRIISSCEKSEVDYSELTSPLFLESINEIEKFFQDKKLFRQTDFYKWQRKKRKILLDISGNPIGGKWSFDDENRLKYPKNKIPPNVNFPMLNTFFNEAVNYVKENFSGNYGILNTKWLYPTTFDEAKAWLRNFLEQRFSEFGPYEDSILAKYSIINHSLISPLLNVGLITPEYLVREILRYADENNIPLNSLEGFIRQIIGWREFIRAVYELSGSFQRKRNFWDFTRKIPEPFWKGTTGIEPLDIVINRVLETGYCHHIERLMVLGNFMLLCEFHPDEVYSWFMTLFIDAYDWVMVPNVYGMSQFADGGLMSSKPYLSGSNYLLKMSDFRRGEWQTIWDSLFWRFLNINRDFFTQNHRLGMLVKTFDNFDEKRKIGIMNTADKYLKSIF